MGFVKSAAILISLGIAAAAGGIYFGAVHPGADEPHSAIVFKLIETARNRAIVVRANNVVVPSLGDAAQLRSGAGNYAAMCTGCHLAPGLPATELSKGLYPAPPALAQLGAPDPARAFWVIKHGIKASGMPAWGKSMPDEYIWNMVAFVQQMPDMSPAQYQTLVAESGGHSHGGGESMAHHDEQTDTDHHDDADAAHDDTRAAHHDHAPAPASATTHVHADGKTHVHEGSDTATDAPSEPKPRPHDAHGGH